MAKPTRTASTWVAPTNNRWLSSLVSFLKVNVDATVGQSGTHGAVAVISRHQNGVFQRGSTIVFPTISDPTTLETMAVREALALSEDLYNQRIHVASYCKIVVDKVRSGSCAQYGAIIREIK